MNLRILLKKQTSGPKVWADAEGYAGPYTKAQTLCCTHRSTPSYPLRTLQSLGIAVNLTILTGDI